MADLLEGRHSDVLLIGAGPNSLIAAAYLLKDGYSVRILEGRDQLGGAAVTEEFAPDYFASTCIQLMEGWSPKIEKELKLPKAGLDVASRQVPTVALSLDGSHLVLPARGRDLLEKLAAVSREDAAAYPRFQKRMDRYAAILEPVLRSAADHSSGTRMASMGTTLRQMLSSLQRWGEKDRHRWMQDQTTSLAALLDSFFESDHLKGTLALDALLGQEQHTHAPGSALALFQRAALRRANRGLHTSIAGGMGAWTDRLVQMLTEQGADILTNCQVTRILTRGGVAEAVSLSDGTTYEADVILSAADARTTYVKLVGAEKLQPTMRRRLSRIRQSGAMARVHLALEGLPIIEGCTETEYGGRLMIAPSMAHIDQAFAAAKRGEIPEDPVMEAYLPSFHDYRLAPPGHHVMSITVPFLPAEPEGGWAAQSEALTTRVVNVLAQYADDLKLKIIAGHTLTPDMLTTQFGMGHGGWHKGDLTLDQSWIFRPAPGLADGAGPIEGLFLCGASAHPGGGLHGINGQLAAEKAHTYLKEKGQADAAK